jgi:hypothetical protein
VDYEDEVEQHLRVDAWPRAKATRHRGYRLLLFEDRGGVLVAAGSHAAERLVLTGGDIVSAARLVAFAVGLAHQGQRVAGRPLADVALTRLIRDALAYRRVQIVSGIASLENARSITVCERNGLTSQSPFSPGYVRLTGRFRSR